MCESESVLLLAETSKNRFGFKKIHLPIHFQGGRLPSRERGYVSYLKGYTPQKSNIDIYQKLPIVLKRATLSMAHLFGYPS